MEFIGLALGFGLFLAISIGVGASLLLITWLLTRPLRLHCAPVLLAAWALPPACLLWLYVCAAILPHESLFGDIDQPLPNGYALRAMGKFHDYAEIEKVTDPLQNAGPSGHVDSLQVTDDLIAGHYNPLFEGEPSAATYFLLNTRSGTRRDFSSLADLQRQLGRPLTLEPADSFRSHETSAHLWAWFDRIVICGPMLAGTAVYVLLLLWSRRSRVRRTFTA